MTSVANRAPAVDRFLDALDHPLKEGIACLRAAILDADPDISERIKWNAPSFCIDGDDRVTFKLHPADRLQLIFHRGATVKEPTGFAFADPTGLIAWRTADRGIVTLCTMDEIAAHQDALVATVTAWMAATRT
jgi:hypothetical protein